MAKGASPSRKAPPGNGNRLERLAESESDRLLTMAAPEADEVLVDGVRFDLDDLKFPKALKNRAFGSGGYPYREPMKGSDYDAELRLLQIELVKLQHAVMAEGRRILILFEGRDAAGKGGTIGTLKEYLNPRWARAVALSKPSDVESGQWYFQRYIAELPAAGEIVLFDRSWYNRAGVERVMGFAKPAQVEDFLGQVPRVEQLLSDDGIILVKFWLDIGREMQLKRFHDRRHDALKIWKLSPVDLKALSLWDDYTQARDAMFERTHSTTQPWIVVRSNDKRRARLNAIRYLLHAVDYAEKSLQAIGPIDPAILMTAPEFLDLKPESAAND
jgi:polyphosphate kinase 2